MFVRRFTYCVIFWTLAGVCLGEHRPASRGNAPEKHTWQLYSYDAYQLLLKTSPPKPPPSNTMLDSKIMGNILDRATEHRDHHVDNLLKQLERLNRTRFDKLWDISEHATPFKREELRKDIVLFGYCIDRLEPETYLRGLMSTYFKAKKPYFISLSHLKDRGYDFDKAKANPKTFHATAAKEISRFTPASNKLPQNIPLREMMHYFLSRGLFSIERAEKTGESTHYQILKRGTDTSGKEMIILEQLCADMDGCADKRIPYTGPTEFCFYPEGVDLK